jgi:hypothetical protein
MCMHAPLHARTYMHANLCAQMHTQTHTYVRTCVKVHARAHVYTHVGHSTVALRVINYLFGCLARNQGILQYPKNLSLTKLCLLSQFFGCSNWNLKACVHVSLCTNFWRLSYPLPFLFAHSPFYLPRPICARCQNNWNDWFASIKVLLRLVVGRRITDKRKGHQHQKLKGNPERKHGKPLDHPKRQALIDTHFSLRAQALRKEIKRRKIKSGLDTRGNGNEGGRRKNSTRNSRK